MIIGIYGAKNMEYIKTTDLDLQKTFFHFTRIDNRDNIEMNGLMAVAGGENNTINDKSNPTIYFSYGVGGLLKTVDVWIKWEYYNLIFKHYYRYAPSEKISEKLMDMAFDKVYEDFKNRNYYALQLIEGTNPQTSDFSFSGIDKKKEDSYKRYLQRLQDFKEGKSSIKPTYPHPDMAWLYGTYSDFSNGNIVQEDWNMNTHIGNKTIPTNRIKIIESKSGRTDALSVVLEIYNTYRERLANMDISVLDGFIKYANNRYVSDADYAPNSKDIGRRKVHPEVAQKYANMNNITAQNANGKMLS